MRKICVYLMFIFLISITLNTSVDFGNFINHVTFNQNPYNFCWAFSLSSHMSFTYLMHSNSEEYKVFNPLQITLYSIPGTMNKKNADGGQRMVNVMEKLKGYTISTLDEGDTIIYDDPKKQIPLTERQIAIDSIKPLFMLNLATSSLKTKRKYDVLLQNQNQIKPSLKVVGSINCDNIDKKYTNCDNLENGGYMKLIELGPYIAGMKINIEKDKLNGNKGFYSGVNRLEKYFWTSDLCWKNGQNEDYLLYHAILVLSIERVTKNSIPKEFRFIKEGYFKVTILNSWGSLFGKNGKAEIYFKDEKSDCGLLNNIYVPVYDVNKEKYEDLIGKKFIYNDKATPYEGFPPISEEEKAFLSTSTSAEKANNRGLIEDFLDY